MLNDVHFEGLVVDSYTYSDDLFLRVASYRDPARPVKPGPTATQDAPDYIYARIINGVKAKNLYQINDTVRIKGFLQSREFNEDLSVFLKKAQKHPQTALVSVEIVGGKPFEVVCGRDTLELVVEDIVNTTQTTLARKPVLNPNAGRQPPADRTTIDLKKPVQIQKPVIKQPKNEKKQPTALLDSPLPKANTEKSKRIHRSNKKRNQQAKADKTATPAA